MSAMDWLFRKPPRQKKVCLHCKGGFGLTRPNYPFCSPKCKQEHQKCPESSGELVKLLRYP